jgi:hypothetical protein
MFWSVLAHFGKILPVLFLGTVIYLHKLHMIDATEWTILSFVVLSIFGFRASVGWIGYGLGHAG